MQPSGTHLRGRPRPRVLVLDDEPLLCRALTRVLDGDVAVTAILDAREAIARIRGGESFDAILCDLMMSPMSGIDFFHALARIRPDDARRVVFMTGGVHTREGRAFRASSTNPWLEKPVDLAVLRDVIQRTVDEARAARVAGGEG